MYHHLIQKREVFDVNRTRIGKDRLCITTMISQLILLLLSTCLILLLPNNTNAFVIIHQQQQHQHRTGSLQRSLQSTSRSSTTTADDMNDATTTVDDSTSLDVVSTDDNDISTAITFTEMEIQVIRSLYDKCQSNMTHVERIMLETLPTLRPSLLMKLRDVTDTYQYNHDNNDNSNSNDNDTDSTTVTNIAIQYVSNQMNDMLVARLELAKTTLYNLLNAGEIRKLDHLIGTAARSGTLDVAFFNVLTYNIQEAMVEESELNSNNNNNNSSNTNTATVISNNEGGLNIDTTEGSASRLQILKHIYTRCQEEVEKMIPPGTALLNKLLRTEQESIRSNLYEYYLTPPKATTTITTPDGTILTLNNTQSSSSNNNNTIQAKSLVSIEEFVKAIDDAVLQIRDVENVGGTDHESAAMMVEGCRYIAKEARIIIGTIYGRESKELHIFEEGLQPVFRPTNSTSPYIQGRI